MNNDKLTLAQTHVTTHESPAVAFSTEAQLAGRLRSGCIREGDTVKVFARDFDEAVAALTAAYHRMTNAEARAERAEARVKELEDYCTRNGL